MSLSETGLKPTSPAGDSKSSPVRIILTSSNGSSRSLMTTLRFDNQTTVSDLLGLLAQQERLSAEEAAGYVIRTPELVLSPDTLLNSLKVDEIAYLEHIPRYQRVKISGPDITSTKLLSLDALTSVGELVASLAPDFHLKEENAALVLLTIVCPHPPIILSEINQQRNSTSTTSNNTTGGTNPPTLISAGTMNPDGSAIELDPNENLFQQGVRSGAHLQLLRKKMRPKDLMNKLLGRRKSTIAPMISKRNSIPSDLSSSLKSSSSPSSPSILSSSQTSMSNLDSDRNTILLSATSRISPLNLIKIMTYLKIHGSKTTGLFSNDYTIEQIISFKSNFHANASQQITEKILQKIEKNLPLNEFERIGDIKAIAALLLHCLNCLEPKLLEQSRNELSRLVDDQFASQIPSIISNYILQDEKMIFVVWASMCHEMSKYEATNGLNSSKLSRIFLNSFFNLDTLKSTQNTKNDDEKNSADYETQSTRLSNVLKFVIDNPLILTEKKKQSKKEKKEKEKSKSKNNLNSSNGNASISSKDGTLDSSLYQSASEPHLDLSVVSSGTSNLQNVEASTQIDETASSNDLPENSLTSSNADKLRQEIAQASFFMIADFPWTPTMDGDIELKKGDIVQVLVTDPQGWYVGKVLNSPTNPVGVFPSTYCTTITKKDVEILLKVESSSLFDSDDASSDDSSSSLSTSSLYHHLVSARVGGYSHSKSPKESPQPYNLFGKAVKSPQTVTSSQEATTSQIVEETVPKSSSLSEPKIDESNTKPVAAVPADTEKSVTKSERSEIREPEGTTPTNTQIPQTKPKQRPDGSAVANSSQIRSASPMLRHRVSSPSLKAKVDIGDSQRQSKQKASNIQQPTETNTKIPPQSSVPSYQTFPKPKNVRSSLPDPITIPLDSRVAMLGTSPNSTSASFSHLIKTNTSKDKALEMPPLKLHRVQSPSNLSDAAGSPHSHRSSSNLRYSGRPLSPRVGDRPPSSNRSPRGDNSRFLSELRESLHAEDELERSRDLISQLKSTVFALEESNKVMKNTVTEQELAMERLTREMELLKMHAFNNASSSSLASQLSQPGSLPDLAEENDGNDDSALLVTHSNPLIDPSNPDFHGRRFANRKKTGRRNNMGGSEPAITGAKINPDTALLSTPPQSQSSAPAARYNHQNQNYMANTPITIQIAFLLVSISLFIYVLQTMFK